MAVAIFDTLVSKANSSKLTCRLKRSKNFGLLISVKIIGRLLISNKGLFFKRVADILEGIMIIVFFIFNNLPKSLRLTDAN